MAGTRSDGFDFTGHIRNLVADIVEQVPDLSHIGVERIAFSFSQTRKAVLHGLQASLTPLRFEGGAREGLYRGRRMRVQQVRGADGDEMLYILTFYLPRFQNLEFGEKLTTVFHELWHISPDFDGDIRRHPGRCYAHTHSQAEFEAQLEPFIASYMQTPRASRTTEFLQRSFAELQTEYGRVFGTRIQRPKLLPVAGSARPA